MSPNAAESPVAIVRMTAQEAAARLDQFGPNEPAPTRIVRAKAVGKRESVWPSV
jgi:hypothetical protein